MSRSRSDGAKRPNQSHHAQSVHAPGTASSSASAPLRNVVTRTAFSLTELLIVVAIIVLLLTMISAGLQWARAQARSVVCAQRLRDFGVGLHSYTTEEDDWFPGVNTSGVAVRTLKCVWYNNPGLLHRRHLPVQSYDWMSPTLPHISSLPARRAERFHLLLDEWRCPAQGETSVIWGTPRPEINPDLADFEQIGPWPAVSYLMPVHHQYFGHKSRRLLASAPLAGQGEYKVYSLSAPNFETDEYGWEVQTASYLPQLFRLEQADRKIFAADGTRFLPNTLVLDHDISPDPMWFGSFTSAGAWWTGSRSYGVRAGTRNWDGRLLDHVNQPPSGGQNLALSYRHGQTSDMSSGDAHDNNGWINAVFFDGHAETLSDRKSRSPVFWYPTGGEVKAASEGMTDLPVGSVIP